MAFLQQFTFVKLVKGTLLYCTMTIVLSAIQMTGSQFDMLDIDFSNDSTRDLACMDFDSSCSSLPPVCIMCDLFQDDLPTCDYNVNTTFSCWALDNVTCEV